jgi:hypothetical protein
MKAHVRGERTPRKVRWEEGHRRGEQNLPTAVHSAEDIEWLYHMSR